MLRSTWHKCILSTAKYCMICCISKYPITKRIRNLANQNGIQISLQTCGISEQAFGSRCTGCLSQPLPFFPFPLPSPLAPANRLVYTGGCRLSATQAKAYPNPSQLPFGKPWAEDLCSRVHFPESIHNLLVPLFKRACHAIVTSIEYCSTSVEIQKPKIYCSLC